MAAPGAWLFTNNAKNRLAKGKWDIDAASLKVRLLQSTSNIGASTTLASGVSNEVANGNGYTTGGIAVDLVFNGALDSGVWKVTVQFDVSPVWTASGGGLAARWAELYEPGGDTLAYMLLDSAPADVTASAGNQLTVDHDGTPVPLYIVS